MIRLRGVSKSYGSAAGTVTALSDVSFEVETGEFVAIVGQSGCGKSTLLNLIGGLDVPTAGRIDIDECKDTGRISEFGFCFQDATLLPWLTVVENVLLPYRVTGTVSADHRLRAENLLRLVGLDRFIQYRPWELSGGMQSRVALCRALVHAPPILLLDEPFAALDALTRETLVFELQKMWLDYRPTTFLVTHSIAEAVALADKVVVMSDRPGTIRDIVRVPLERPRNADAQYSEAFRGLERKIKGLIFARTAA